MRGLGALMWQAHVCEIMYVVDATHENNSYRVYRVYDIEHMKMEKNMISSI